MTASAMARTSSPENMPAYSEIVSVTTGTTEMHISSKVSGSCAFAWARPAKARNMISPITPNRSDAASGLAEVVRKNADHAEIPMTMTSASPTLGGGETGRFARSTPVSTGASAEGCHPIHSQTTNAAVVPKLNRSTK